MAYVASKIEAKNNLPIALVDGNRVGGGHNYPSPGDLELIPTDVRRWGMVCGVTSQIGTTDFYSLHQPDEEADIANNNNWRLEAEGQYLYGDGSSPEMSDNLTLRNKYLKSWGRTILEQATLTLIDCEVAPDCYFSGYGILALRGSTSLINAGESLGGSLRLDDGRPHGIVHEMPYNEESAFINLSYFPCRNLVVDASQFSNGTLEGVGGRIAGGDWNENIPLRLYAAPGTVLNFSPASNIVLTADTMAAIGYDEMDATKGLNGDDQDWLDLEARALPNGGFRWFELGYKKYPSTAE